jgi:hypothetical protein
MNKATFRLIGTDDENALFECSFCRSVIPVELDEDGNIELMYVDDTCPECGAIVVDFDLE